MRFSVDELLEKLIKMIMTSEKKLEQTMVGVEQ